MKIGKMHEEVTTLNLENHTKAAEIPIESSCSNEYENIEDNCLMFDFPEFNTRFTNNIEEMIIEDAEEIIIDKDVNNKEINFNNNIKETILTKNIKEKNTNKVLTNEEINFDNNNEKTIIDDTEEKINNEDVNNKKNNFNNIEETIIKDTKEKITNPDVNNKEVNFNNDNKEAIIEFTEENFNKDKNNKNINFNNIEQTIIGDTKENIDNKDVSDKGINILQNIVLKSALEQSENDKDIRLLKKRTVSGVLQDVKTWPDDSSEKSKRKRIQLPSVITSDKWIEIFEANEKTKENLAAEKAAKRANKTDKINKEKNLTKKKAINQTKKENNEMILDNSTPNKDKVQSTDTVIEKNKTGRKVPFWI